MACEGKQQAVVVACKRLLVVVTLLAAASCCLPLRLLLCAAGGGVEWRLASAPGAVRCSCNQRGKQARQLWWRRRHLGSNVNSGVTSMG